MERSSGAGHLARKTETRAARARFGLVHANGKGAHGGGPWGGLDVVVDVLSTYDSAGSGRNA